MQPSSGMSMRPLSRFKVLIVDDDPVVLEVVRERLERAGYEVHTREDALGTSQWVARERPDFLLLDVTMPALGGGELGQLLRRGRGTNQTAVILHSGMTKAALAPVVIRTGALGAIIKGHDAERFIAEFQALVDQHLTQVGAPVMPTVPAPTAAPRARPSELGRSKPGPVEPRAAETSSSTPDARRPHRNGK